MKLATHIKPISHLIENTEVVISRLVNDPEPMVFTQDGEARAVLMSVPAYDELQRRINEMEESLALLQLLMVREKEANEGQLIPASEVFRRLKEKHREVA